MKNLENNGRISVVAGDTNNEDVRLLDEEEGVGSNLFDGVLGLLGVDDFVAESFVHGVSVCKYVSLVFSLQVHSHSLNSVYSDS